MGLPSREYQDTESGEKKYISIIRFIQKEHHEAFCKAALQAVDDWCAKQVQGPVAGGFKEEEELPF